MSVSFYVKAPKKLFGAHKPLTVNQALQFTDNHYQIYNFDTSPNDPDYRELLDSTIDHYDCLLLGIDEQSGRGFELSYDNNTQYYAVRLFTPSTERDWQIAFNYCTALARQFKSAIWHEDGIEMSIEQLMQFDYRSDILIGLKSFLRDDYDNYKILGLHRPMAFNRAIANKLLEAADPIAAFGELVHELQYNDAYSANQMIYRQDETDRIMVSYTLTEDTQTILPFKPTIEFDNMAYVHNDDVDQWLLTLVKSNGDTTDPGNFQVADRIDYDVFIAALDETKYRFIDASYIVVEAHSHADIQALLQRAQAISAS